VRFGILGPLEAWDGDQRLGLGGPQQRALLAALLLDANRVVSADRLIECLWGERPPPAARGLLQGCVAQLRRVLRTDARPQPLLTRAPGYLLDVPAGARDVDRFDELAATAGGCAAGGSKAALERAASLLREALSLWRGPVLDGVTLEACQAEIGRLEERRLAVLEERIDVELRLGHHAELVSDLWAHIRAHPLRERLWAQLMLALSGAERRADALAAFREVRQTLVEQLGVEPGATLQQLHVAILSGADAMDAYRTLRGWPAALLEPPALPEPAVVARNVARVVPAQLPATTASFTGRSRYLKRLDELLVGAGDGVTIGVVSGTAGVGKTALALHWAHRVRERFDDGQLYVDLRGYAPPPPVRSIEALAGFLPALGVPADQVPADLDQAAALYRSLLAGKRVLVLLDNAHSAEQVRPLLPGSAGCLVLVTSRERLGGLVARDGAAHLDLDLLEPHEANTLLERVLGRERVGAAPMAAEELARLCAFLPLALRIAAASLTLHPQRSMAEQVARLAAGDRLAALAVDRDEQSAVRTAFDHSYAGLPPDARRLFRLLGLVPGPRVTVDAAAALTGTSPRTAAGLLSRLAGAHLLDQPAPGRYSLHDLLRLYAADCARDEEPADGRQAAIGRLCDWYLSTTDAAARLLYPEMLGLRLPGRTGASHTDFADHPEALAWLEAERPNLLAAIQHTAVHGPHPVAYRLADMLQGFYIARSHIVEWRAVAHAELAAARAHGDQDAQAAAERSLGNVHTRQNGYPEAVEHFHRALALSERTGWVEAQCSALNGLGLVYRRQWRLPEAMDCLRRALTLNRQAGYVDGQLANLGNLGLVCLHLGRLEQAAGYTVQSLPLARQLGSRSREAAALGNLGEIRHMLGRLDEAEADLHRALAAGHEVGELSNRAENQRALAAVYRDAGRSPQALALAEAALLSAREGDRREVEADTLDTLGTIHHRLGQHQRALEHHERALRLGQASENRLTMVVALAGAAAAQLCLDRIEAAGDAAARAVQQAREGGFRLAEGNALTTLAAVDRAAGRFGRAVGHAQQAVAIQQETGHRLGEVRARRELERATDRVS
jgi:DNA-binding SARP family transcriptional activator/tetratricopeptide (TPR) repeat protein